MRRVFWTSLCLSAMACVAGCASHAGNDECLLNLPKSCPDQTLTYASGVAPILDTSCSPCHAPGGVESTVPLTNYTQVSNRLTSIAGQLQTCSMPPAGAAPLAASDRQTIIDWIACRAPP
jgi:hypothetical protein